MKATQSFFPMRTEESIALDFGPLELIDQTDETFDDLIARRQYQHGPLGALSAVRAGLSPGTRIEILNSYPGTIDEGYLLLQKMLLTKAGLIVRRANRTDDGCVIQVERRPDVYIEYDYGLRLEEAVTGKFLERCHEFAKEVYYYKDFNYDYEVARQFDLNSDMFAVMNPKDEILAVGRGILREPGYNCPFMYATTTNGLHYRVPPQYRGICEIMGLYREGRQGVVAFKKLMEYLTQYAYYVAQVDSVWTTYDHVDAYTGAYYRRKLLMEDTGVRLTYRDFGGLWNLICTDRITELRDLHEGIFKL